MGFSNVYCNHIQLYLIPNNIIVVIHCVMIIMMCNDKNTKILYYFVGYGWFDKRMVLSYWQSLMYYNNQRYSSSI